MVKKKSNKVCVKGYQSPCPVSTISCCCSDSVGPIRRSATRSRSGGHTAEENCHRKLRIRANSPTLLYASPQ
ncbi:unnamed protein product [Linum trigynum]|uniref:Uncharacterized protein n=1 Tax=Linum trigynum TaxID=586398 RepID=A0AAV2DPN4_9ROSI